MKHAHTYTHTPTHTSLIASLGPPLMRISDPLICFFRRPTDLRLQIFQKLHILDSGLKTRRLFFPPSGFAPSSFYITKASEKVFLFGTNLPWGGNHEKGRRRAVNRRRPFSWTVSTSETAHQTWRPRAFHPATCFAFSKAARFNEGKRRITADSPLTTENTANGLWWHSFSQG